MELALTRIELMKDIRPDSIHWQMFKDNYIKKEKEQMFDLWNGGINCTEEGGKSFDQYYEIFKKD